MPLESTRSLAAADLVLTLTAAALWYVKPELGPWPLLLVAGGIASGVWLSKTGANIFPRSFLGPSLLFLVTAAIGLAIAYDRGPAWNKFWTIVGGMALFASFARAPERVRLPVLGERSLRTAFLLLFPALVAGYFLLTNDWGRWSSKLPMLDPVMTWLSSWPLDLPGHRLHPNVAGGLIAAFIPLQLAAGRGKRYAPFLIAISFLALALTVSRGAWVALAAVAGAWGLRRLVSPQRMLLALVILIAAGLLLVVVVQPPSVSGRLELLRNSSDLALDYPLTGLGLAGFPLAYSSYVLLVHVAHTVHSHNLFMDLWIEQGALGLLAFVWMLGIAALLARGGQRWAFPATAAIGVILLHGMVDDAFYGSRGILVLFIPFAVLVATGQAANAWPSRRVVLGGALLILLLALLPPVRAALWHNAGALSQTRAELSVYKWPEWPIQDALRRSPDVHLDDAIGFYETALTQRGNDAAAHRRLGQIELSRGNYPEARSHLEQAYAAKPGQRMTRTLLGEAYAIAGDVEGAAALWRTVDLGQGQLEGRAWWYEYLGETEHAANIRQAKELAGY